jgi:hypothetical protein
LCGAFSATYVRFHTTLLVRTACCQTYAACILCFDTASADWSRSHSPLARHRLRARSAGYGSKTLASTRPQATGTTELADTEDANRGMIRPLSHSPHRPISRGAAPDAIEFPTAGLAAARNRVELPLRIEASTTVPTRHCDKPPQHCFHLGPERTRHSSSDGSAHVCRVLRYRGRQPIARLCRTRPHPHEWKL